MCQTILRGILHETFRSFISHVKYSSFVFSPGTGLKECILSGLKGGGQGRHFSYLVSLTMYIELEVRMIPPNETLDEPDQLNHF